MDFSQEDNNDNESIISQVWGGNIEESAGSSSGAKMRTERMQVNTTEYLNYITSSTMRADHITNVLHILARIPRNTELPREVHSPPIQFMSSNKIMLIEQQDIARLYWMYQLPDLKKQFRAYIDREHMKMSFPEAVAEEKGTRRNWTLRKFSLRRNSFEEKEQGK